MADKRGDLIGGFLGLDYHLGQAMNRIAAARDGDAVSLSGLEMKAIDGWQKMWPQWDGTCPPSTDEQLRAALSGRKFKPPIGQQHKKSAMTEIAAAKDGEAVAAEKVSNGDK